MQNIESSSSRRFLWLASKTTEVEKDSNKAEKRSNGFDFLNHRLYNLWERSDLIQLAIIIFSILVNTKPKLLSSLYSKQCIRATNFAHLQPYSVLYSYKGYGKQNTYARTQCEAK